jgi:hypothetical protein
MANRVLLCLVFLLTCFGVGTAYAQTGKLSGRVTEKANKAAIPGVSVVVKLNGGVKGFSTTDDKGNYSVSALVPGNYTVEFVSMTFAPVKIANVPIEMDKTRFLNAEMVEEGVNLGPAEVVAYKIPVIDPDNTTTGGTLTNEAIMKIPTREVGTLVSTQPGVFAADDRGAVNLKGTRSSNTVYFVNGVKINGTTPNLPVQAISQLSVITGGVPAQYGDAVGGIISITTTSPSAAFSGGIDLETSTPLDQYDNNLGSFNLMGPILKRKAEEGKPASSLLGFFVSGQFQNSKDDSPIRQGLYQVRPDVLARINERPFVNTLIGTQEQAIEASRLLRLSDLEKVKVRPNSASQRVSFNTTLDFQPFDNMMLSLGGSYDRYRQDLYSEFGGLLNSQNNGRRFTDNWNVFARFTQNFPSDGSSSLIKNAYYQVQADFSRFDRTVQSEQYKNNFARYGYIGQIRQDFDLVRGTANAGGQQLDSTARFTIDGVDLPVVTQTLNPTGVSFTPSGDNPIVANYTNQLLTDNSLVLAFPNIVPLALFANGGYLNGTPARTVQNVYGGPTGAFNGYLRQINDQYRVSALGAADIGKHTVKLGFEFEQRVESFFQVTPNGLWQGARGLMNRHIDVPDPTQIDLTRPWEGYYTRRIVNGEPVAYFTQIGIPFGQAESDFSRTMRARIGANRLEFVNVDEALNPDNFSLRDFTADEAVIQQRIVDSYQGYTYTGERNTSKRVAFRDFFFDTQNRPQDAYRPTYAAAFLEDKFTVEDLIIRAGVRIDRFDANQQVLKDKYALVELERVRDINYAEFQDPNGQPAFRPANIGDDFTILTERAGGVIRGYRDGDIFYDANGLVTQDLNPLLSRRMW